MHETPASEEEDTRDFTLRETERLKFITGRSVGTEEEAKKDEKKDQKSDKEQSEEVEVEEKKEEELTPGEKLYNHYMQLEDEVLIKMGLRQAKVEERRKSSLGGDRRKSSTAAVMKGFLKP